MRFAVLLVGFSRAYDYSTAEDGIAGHNANWYGSHKIPRSTPSNSDQAITDYINAGVPSNKILVGMPLYGRSLANTNRHLEEQRP